jgi:hypothetical protein
MEVHQHTHIPRKKWTHMHEGNPSLFNKDKQLINELVMKIHIAKRNKLDSIHHLNRLKEKANNLIPMIKEEYRLK